MFKFEQFAKRGQYSPTVKCKGTEKLLERRQVNEFFLIRLVKLAKTSWWVIRFVSQSGHLGLLPKLGHPSFILFSYYIFITFF